MKRLVIAVDCDDVIIQTTPATIEHYNRTYGTSIPLAQAYSTDLALWGVESDDVAIARVYKFMESASPGLEPLQDAIDSLKLLSRSHELHLITGRADYLQEATREWIARHVPEVFTSLEFTNYVVPIDRQHVRRSKLDVCRQVGADILIDDHIDHACSVAAGGIPVLLFGDYPWNDAETAGALPSNIIRAKDWVAVLAYCSTVA